MATKPKKPHRTNAQIAADAVHHADALKAIIDDLAQVIEKHRAAGYCLTANIKGGVLGMVACYKIHAAPVVVTGEPEGYEADCQ